MQPLKKKILVFGYGLSVILVIVGLRITLRNSFWGWPIVLFLIAMILTAVASIRWEWLTGFYNKWMQAAQVIGQIVTAVILTCVFYFVFGPFGLVLRLLKKDLLDRQFICRRETYWVKTEPRPFQRENYLRQF
ncbi:MAG: hypothetical protein WC552_07265 [Candidatus Omnitrophota bacterium]